MCQIAMSLIAVVAATRTARRIVRTRAIELVDRRWVLLLLAGMERDVDDVVRGESHAIAGVEAREAHGLVDEGADKPLPLNALHLDPHALSPTLTTGGPQLKDHPDVITGSDLRLLGLCGNPEGRWVRAVHFNARPESPPFDQATGYGPAEALV